MALPSRKKQIERVMEILDSEEYEDLSLEQMSTLIVDGYIKAITPKKIPPPPHPGMAFVTPFDNHVHFIAYEDRDRVWIVHEKSHYGQWVDVNLVSFWNFIEEKPDGRRDKTGPRPGQPGNNPDWRVGDRVSLSQRAAKYEIVATGDNCVLMEDMRTGEFQADSNDNMERYYRREESIHDNDF